MKFAVVLLAGAGGHNLGHKRMLIAVEAARWVPGGSLHYSVYVYIFVISYHKK